MHRPARIDRAGSHFAVENARAAQIEQRSGELNLIAANGEIRRDVENIRRARRLLANKRSAIGNRSGLRPPFGLWCAIAGSKAGYRRLAARPYHDELAASGRAAVVSRTYDRAIYSRT